MADMIIALGLVNKDVHLYASWIVLDWIGEDDESERSLECYSPKESEREEWRSSLLLLQQLLKGIMEKINMATV